LDRLSSSHPWLRERVRVHTPWIGENYYTPLRDKKISRGTRRSREPRMITEKGSLVLRFRWEPAFCGANRERRQWSHEVLNVESEELNAAREQNHHQRLSEDIGDLVRRRLVLHRDLTVLHELPNSEISGGNVFGSS